MSERFRGRLAQPGRWNGPRVLWGEKIKGEDVQPGHGMSAVTSSQKLARTQGSTFIRKRPYLEEECLKRQASDSQNRLTEQPSTAALQAECDVLSEGDLNNLE